MNNSLIIIILIFITLFIGIIFAIRYAIKNSEKEYKGANIISFVFPIIGLIIYAINIGKNDKLAKSSSKAALMGMCTAVMLFFMIKTIMYVTAERESVNYGSKMNNNNKIDIEDNDNKNKYDSLDSLREELLKDNYISNCEIDTKDILITIKIDYKENDFYDMKFAINSIVKKYNFDTKYTYNIRINNKYHGFYSGIKNENIVWTPSEDNK